MEAQSPDWSILSPLQYRGTFQARSKYVPSARSKRLPESKGCDSNSGSVSAELLHVFGGIVHGGSGREEGILD